MQRSGNGKVLCAKLIEQSIYCRLLKIRLTVLSLQRRVQSFWPKLVNPIARLRNCNRLLEFRMDQRRALCEWNPSGMPCAKIDVSDTLLTLHTPAHARMTDNS